MAILCRPALARPETGVGLPKAWWRALAECPYSIMTTTRDRAILKSAAAFFGAELDRRPKK